jgi:hypothetical protein
MPTIVHVRAHPEIWMRSGGPIVVSALIAEWRR